MAPLICLTHGGPLRHRDEESPNEPGGGTWVCPGWDGEGCPNVLYPLSDGAYRRVASGIARWPGVIIEGGERP